MTTLEIKNQLIHRISEINDVSYLRALKTILDSKILSDKVILNEELKKQISESQTEIQKGLYKTQESLDNEVLRWANEK
jgi:hypothetical protein